ncbi:hypothetical protein MPL1032_160096 [Mesorhizobium plurifarium]|uniref:Uncharacterized protein n=1 Tax=Mesorhizobium plurifarium TaxID=69974 RepID=A0A0K2VTD6_MESPL|nr:hypothetical protein MPL1032_160096 [Mesorhizobium plurifarium]
MNRHFVLTFVLAHDVTQKVCNFLASC